MIDRPTHPFARRKDLLWLNGLGFFTPSESHVPCQQCCGTSGGESSELYITTTAYMCAVSKRVIEYHCVLMYTHMHVCGKLVHLGFLGVSRVDMMKIDGSIWSSCGLFACLNWSLQVHVCSLSIKDLILSMYDSFLLKYRQYRSPRWLTINVREYHWRVCGQNLGHNRHKAMETW